MSQYRMQDTAKPDGFYVQFERVLYDDNETSVDDFDCYDDDDREEFASGSRSFVGVVARAKCLSVQNGVGVHLSFESPGVWGVDGDDTYYNELYREEVQSLKDIIATMKNPTFEDVP